MRRTTLQTGQTISISVPLDVQTDLKDQVIPEVRFQAYADILEKIERSLQRELETKDQSKWRTQTGDVAEHASFLLSCLQFDGQTYTTTRAPTHYKRRFHGRELINGIGVTVRLAQDKQLTATFYADILFTRKLAGCLEESSEEALKEACSKAYE